MPDLLPSLRHTAPTERRGGGDPPYALEELCLPWTSEDRVRFEALPAGFDKDVFLRVLDLVHGFRKEPGLFVVLHIPSESSLRLDTKKAKPEVSWAWLRGPAREEAPPPAGPCAPAAGLLATRCIRLLDKNRLLDNIRLLNKFPEEDLFKNLG